MTKRRQRRYFGGEEKVAILKRHLLEQVSVSSLCDQHDLNPNLFYRWQKEFFEGGAAAFERDASREVAQLKRQIFGLEDRLARKDSVLAEITEAYVRCKKKDGEI